MYFIRSDEPSLLANDITSSTKEMVREFARWDSPAPMKITRESLQLCKQLGVYTVGGKTQTIRRL